MDRLILRCLPREVRARYADEIQTLLDQSRRPFRDRCDLVFAAIGLRFGSVLLACLVGSVLGLGLSVAAVIVSISNLGGGAGEVADHWWSALAATGLAASIGATALLFVARHRAPSWRETSTSR